MPALSDSRFQCLKILKNIDINETNINHNKKGFIVDSVLIVSHYFIAISLL